ncbi:MAG TPA: hypothetical protein VFN78_10755 [Ktedonobacterales bacterium]|nr:hypothetical protein [Ktedonobacterales bacterium]
MGDEMTPRDSATLACAAGVTPERLSAWRDDLLPSDQAEWLTTHVPGCPACAARLRDYDQIGAALRGQVIPRPEADPWPAMRLRLARERRRGPRLPSTPRWGGVSALIAAALLVALFAGLLAQQASRRPAPGSTATATKATATPAAPLVAWTQVPGYKGLYGLAVAPSDPTVAYQLWLDGNGKVITRRTDDQGATWRVLTLPNIPNATYPVFGRAFTAMVSPADAHVVYLNVSALMDSSVTRCGASGDPQDGSQAPRLLCLFQFISADSGAHWQALSLPVSGFLGIDPSPQGDNTTQPHAMRIYDMISGGGKGHLARSDDNGVTWRLIDQPIFAAGQSLMEYAATPIGATVFALTEPVGQAATEGSPPLMIWRSDDAGATWSNLGHASSALIVDVRAALVAQSGKPILYTMMPDLGTNRMTIQGSLYGASGSFHLAPDPAPGCQPSGNSYLLGSLADGSVLAWCGGEVGAWLALPARADPGWRPVAPNPGVNTIQSSFTQTLPDGSTRLWLVIGDNTGARVEYATLSK